MPLEYRFSRETSSTDQLDYVQLIIVETSTTPEFVREIIMFHNPEEVSITFSSGAIQIAPSEGIRFLSDTSIIIRDIDTIVVNGAGPTSVENALTLLKDVFLIDTCCEDSSDSNSCDNCLITDSKGPLSSEGQDGDTYINTATGDLYLKIGGTWVLQGNVFDTTSSNISSINPNDLVWQNQGFWNTVPTDVASGLTKPKYVAVDESRNLAFLAYHEGVGGVSSYDITDRMNPVLLDTIITNWSVNMISRTGVYLIVDNNDRIPTGIEIIDTTNPNNLTIIGQNFSGSKQYFAHVVDDNGDYAYAADSTGSAGLSVYDITNKTSPVNLPNSIGYAAGGVDLNGNTKVFVTEYTARIVHAYDVTNPASPVSLYSSAVLGSSGFIVGLSVNDNGGLVFAEEYNGTTIYILDETNLNLLSTIQVSSVLPQIQGGSNSCFYNPATGILHVMHGLNTGAAMTIFDLTDPVNPVKLCERPFLGIDGLERGSLTSDGYVYLPSRFPSEVLYVSRNPSQVNTEVIVDKMTACTKFVIKEPTVPITPTSPGEPGQLSWDSSGLWLCTSTNNWIQIT